MITRFHIENFKSLVNFDIPPVGAELGPLTCLIGLNGSGKSTLLQAFDFAAQMAIGRVMEWLNQRGWEESDVLTNLGKRSSHIVSFKISFRQTSGEDVTWTARYDAKNARCTSEKIESKGNVLLELEAERLSLAGSDTPLKPIGEKLGLVYQGSILSILDLKERHPLLTFVKENLRQMKSLELLSPQLLRKRASAAEDIGVGGEKFSAFLYRLNQDKTTALLAEVKKFYPHLENWTVKSLRSGWKDLQISENYQGSHKVAAVHMNDGMLRIMAILSQAYSSHTFLLFDEIENGINPELVEKLVNFLINCGKQVVVTTHSPMILNYIPDEIAKKSVFMLYKTKQGETHAKRFFDVEGMEKKLKFLGPGEVFVDTNLSELAHELEGTQPPQLPTLDEQ